MDWLRQRTRATPHVLAILFNDKSWTYAQLDAWVDELCKQLVEWGVRPGMFVATLMATRPGTIAIIHALTRLQAILIPLNTRLTPTELQRQLTHTNCQHLIHDETTAETVEQLSVISFQFSVFSFQFSITHYAPRTTHPAPRTSHLTPDTPHLAPDTSHLTPDTHAILFTSGTTGRPKGVQLSYDNHFWSAMASAYRLGVDKKDLWLSCLPLYHVGGIAVVFRSCLYGTAILLHERFDVERISNDLDTKPVTLTSLVPTMVYRLFNQRGQRPWSPTLRHLLLGGSAATPDLVEQCHALHIPVSTTYGLTEAASQVATMLPDDVRRKPGSVGKPLLFSEVQIVEKDDVGQVVRVCPAGTYGEILVSGKTIMRGYYQNDKATQRTLINGQLHTGDIGYLDDEGDLWVVQRRSDLIVSGGENVYPAEIEAVLRAHPAIAEACVVGLPNAEWGEQVASAIVLKTPLTQDELRIYARQHLAGYKQPRRVVFVDVLPKTGSGKVSRPGVKALFL